MQPPKRHIRPVGLIVALRTERHSSSSDAASVTEDNFPLLMRGECAAAATIWPWRACAYHEEARARRRGANRRPQPLSADEGRCRRPRPLTAAAAAFVGGRCGLCQRGCRHYFRIYQGNNNLKNKIFKSFKSIQF